MSSTRRTLLYMAATILIILAPAIEGALPPTSFWPCYVVAVGLAGYAFIGTSGRAQKLTLILASVALTITAADLVLRFTPIVFDELAEPITHWLEGEQSAGKVVLNRAVSGG